MQDLGAQGRLVAAAVAQQPRGRPPTPHIVFSGQVSALVPAREYMNCGDDGVWCYNCEVEAEHQARTRLLAVPGELRMVSRQVRRKAPGQSQAPDLWALFPPSFSSLSLLAAPSA